MRLRTVLLLVVGCTLTAVPGFAADLYTHDGWAALASDRIARKTGDLLTVLVYENATASDSADSSTQKSSAINGQVSAGPLFGGSGSLNLSNDSDNTGSTHRSGAMVAQITAVVDDVLPNGDLHITGSQVLDINGEKTKIGLRGRVRLADISQTNVVLSSRIADAMIDYDGSGFVSRSAKPGIITRLFQWLGLP